MNILSCSRITILVIMIIAPTSVHTKEDAQPLYSITYSYENEKDVSDNGTITKMKESIKKVSKKLLAIEDVSVDHTVEGNRIIFKISRKAHKGVVQDTLHSLYTSVHNVSALFLEKIQHALQTVAQAPHEIYVYFHGHDLGTAAHDAVDTVLEKENEVAATAQEMIEHAISASESKLDDIIVSVENNV